MTKVKGGQQVLELLFSDLDYIDDTADISLSDVIYDPRGAYQALVSVRDQVAKVKQRITKELEPMLERNERKREALTVVDRVAALEAELAEMRRQIEDRSIRLVDPPRSTGTGGKE